jgi:MSHA biogenesis protein MshM
VSLYLEHFGLSEPPFRITPHTDFFFDGADRGATLEALIYAILHDEGIVKVSGEVGSGKTMLCRVLMERLPAHVETIYLATPSLARDEILNAIGEELDLPLPDSRTSAALRALQEHLIRLYAAGRRVVILVDEAHVMPDETLEQVRLLSNLESNRHKLLQIVLFGQPELDETLAKPSLRQLRDRITHSFRTRPLSEPEVSKYVSFRMRAAGYRGPEVFSANAIGLMTRAASGLTRRINILADKALLSAFTQNAHAVADRQVRAAIADSEFAAVRRPRRTALYVGGAALAVGALIGAAVQWMMAPRAGPTSALPQIQRVPAATALAPKPVSAPSTPEASGSPPAASAPAAAAPIQPLSAQPPVSVQPVQTAPPPTPRLSREQERRLADYPIAGHNLLGSRIKAARETLERAPDDAFSVELFVTSNADPARMERFLMRARDLVPLDKLYVVPIDAPDGYRLRVLYGEFPTRQDAQRAEQQLPPRYQDAFRTAPRSFAELRRQI